MADDYVYFLRNKFYDDFAEAQTELTEVPLNDELKEIKTILRKKPISPCANTRSLKKCLYDLDDMLAKCVAMAQKTSKRSKTPGEKFVSSSSRAVELWSLLRTKYRLCQIKRRLVEVLQAAAASEREISSSILVVKPEAFQYFDESEIHGLDDQIEEIQNLLYENKAIGIVGMGGSGKTVLARSVFHSRRMREDFELKLWIDLSEATDPEKKYFCILVERVGYFKSPCQYGLDEVLCTLYSYIRNQKCLIVLDGLWHYKRGIEQFINVILGSFRGAVIVTSRFLDLAKGLVGEEKIYMIKPLNPKASWSIFNDSIRRKQLPDHTGEYDSAKNLGMTRELDEIEAQSESLKKQELEAEASRYTFKDSRQTESEDPFKKLEEEIKYRCDGVPLAAKTLAEIMWPLCSEKGVWTEAGQRATKKILLRVNVHDRLSLSKAWYRLLRISDVDVERTLYYKNEFLVTTSCDPHDIAMGLGKFCHIEIISVSKILPTRQSN